jgi:Pyruvate/2-oxoacid:ferredoxin oxidoreductase gamma subunit
VFDATAAARELGSEVSANLALLGFASANSDLFCAPEELATTLKGYGGKRLEMSLKAFEAGRERALFSPPL